MEGYLPSGSRAVEYEFMVPVYHDVVSEIPVEAVSSLGTLILIILVAIVLFKFKLPTPKRHKEE